MKKWLIIGFSLMCPVVASAQTINAASCSQSDVQIALNLVSLATATVNIPACTATPWASNINFAIPSITTKLTIQGQTTCTGSGDPASNNLACTDNTIIQDNSAGTFLLAISGGNSSSLRLTGLTFQVGTGALKDPGGLNIAVGSLRVDHNHFNGNVSGTSGSNFLYWGGCTNGVADHNIFDNGTQTGFASRQENGNTCGGKQNGDFPWSQVSPFGTQGSAVFEANLFLNGQAAGASQMNDCVFGGNVTVRFNTLQNGAHLQTHPTGHDGGDDRGCRSTEVYKNVWNFTLSGQIGNTLFFYSAGAGLWWGNTTNQFNTTSGYGSAIQLTDCRSPSPTTRCGYSPGSTWGFCGSSSVWDANGLNGYPCIDQATRGQGDLLSGSFSTSNRINFTLGSATWPRQKLEPLYYWLNAFTELGSGNSTGLISVNGSIWTQNVDYYVSSNSHSGTDCAGFTGATGIGCGPIASRPTTCTPSVGWWATDQGTWNTSGNGAGNGQLYVCTAANTWTLSYVPLAYPHPLTVGSALTPPTNVTVTPRIKPL